METSSIRKDKEQKYIDNMTQLRENTIREYFSSGSIMASISIGLSYPQIECTIPVHCWDDYVKDRLAVFEQQIMLSFGGFNKIQGLGGYVGSKGPIRESSITYSIICTDKHMLESKIKNLKEQLFQESILLSYSQVQTNFI